MAFLKKLGPVLRHPLVIAVLAAAFSALLIPQITRQWQDRQREDDLKQSLLEQVSTQSTTAVREGIALAGGHIQAAGGQSGEDPGDVYAELRNSWLINRASARTPAETSDRDARVRSLRRYVNADYAQSYVDPSAADGCAPMKDLPDVVQTRFQQLEDAAGWTALTYPTENPRFQNSYSVLGEALLIGMERIVYTIVKTPADGFSHGL